MPVIKLNVTTSGAGTASDVIYLRPWKSITCHGVNSGTFSLATLQPEVSNDGTNYVSLGDPITTDGVYSYVCMASFLRINTTSRTSGTQTAYLCAHGFGEV